MIDGEWLSRLRRMISYNPDTGEFLWREKSLGNNPAGSVAGNVDARGYRTIAFEGRRYRAHRLAWVIVYGRFPDGLIDHINRNTSDNRISNLRECTPRENCLNRKLYVTNSSGITGVHRSRNKWVATISDGNTRRKIGYFDNITDAAKAREAAFAIQIEEFESRTRPILVAALEEAFADWRPEEV